MQMDTRNSGSFVALLAGLLSVYSLWLIAYWPGVLSLDSYAILAEATGSPGTPPAGKAVAWLYFVKLFYGTTLRAEAPIAFQLLVSAVVFARIIAWCWAQGLRWTGWMLLVFIALAPHVIFWSGALYPDGIYAVAGAGFLFELWRCVSDQRVSRTSMALLLVVTPFALFARANGLVLLPAALYAVWALHGRARFRLGGIVLTWSAALFVLTQVHKTGSQDALFSMTLFETANFLRAHSLERNTPHLPVSSRTLETLQRYATTEHIIAHSDPDYWDPLVYAEDGPRLGRLNEAERTVIVSEFFRHNLWKNVPAFINSRTNVFLVAALGDVAEDRLVRASHSQGVLQYVPTRSTYRLFDVPRLGHWVDCLHAANQRARWLLWSPAVGIALLGLTLVMAARRRRWHEFAILAPMAAQLVGVIALMSAGEYRYLLPFFMLPLVALPMFSALAPRTHGCPEAPK